MILVNGAAADTVAANDRGLAYGDGVFRTLTVRGARLRCWGRHYRKLERDCAALAIPCPSEQLLRREVEAAAQGQPECVAKIIVTRGIGARGYATPRPALPTRIVMTSAMPVHPPEFATTGVCVHLCATRLAVQPRLAGIKHLNRLENVLARAEWQDAGTAEGLMLDPENNVIGGTMSNLFIVEAGALVTPELSRCGVAGVTRERVLEAAPVHGISCRVETVSLERALQAEEILFVNSVIGVWPVRKLARREWTRMPHAAHVRQWLEHEAN